MKKEQINSNNNLTQTKKEKLNNDLITKDNTE